VHRRKTSNATWTIYSFVRMVAGLMQNNVCHNS